jgi:hypothetical protein
MRLGDRGQEWPLLTQLVVNSVGQVQVRPAVTLDQWAAQQKSDIQNPKAEIES